jgi:predicted transcriptional regulator
MLEYKGNNYRTKKDYASVANILNAISDDKSLVLFKSIAIDSSDFLISKVNLSCKQYYSRISNLIKSDLISRKNKRYFLTSFGKIVYDAQKRIEMAAEDHWKLKAIDSIERSDNRGLPAEEFKKIIDNLIKNQQIRDILFGSHHRQQIATTASPEMKKNSI